MLKLKIRQLLILFVACLPINLLADSTLATRSGNTQTTDVSVFNPITQNLTTSAKSSLMKSYDGAGGMRTFLSSPIMPSSAKASAVLKVAVSNINLIGSVVYSDSKDVGPGMYRLPLATGGLLEPIVVGENKAPIANGGGVAIDGKYYAAWEYDFYGMMLIHYIDCYDMTTWQRLSHKEVSNTTLFASDVSLDPVSGKVYGCYINDTEDGYVFGTGDYTSYKRTAISQISTPWNGVAFDTDGTLYAIDLNGDLLKVNKETGGTTKIGNTGVTPKYQSSAVIDPKSHRLLWSVFGDDKAGKLYEVDKATGAATELCQFPGNEEVCGLTVIAPEAEDYAPAAIENITLNFPNGALTGSVDFNVPATFFCGEAGSGELTYHVLANGNEVSSGATAFGATVQAPVTLEKAGDYEFVVTVANAAGASPKIKASGFIGSDTPVAPKATLTRETNMFILTWNAVTSSVNGGYIDVDNILYTVTRYPDEKIVADKIKGTTFSDPVPEVETLTSYYYTVVANAGGLTSGIAKSNAIAVGSVTPPYNSAFNTSAGLDGFTILDVNNDGKQWKLDSSRAYLAYNSKLDSDDWLITPPMKLEKGKLYKVSYTLSTKSGSFKERIEVKWGNAATPEGMTTTLLEPLEFASLIGIAYENYITPENDGVYYIGFHGISVKNAYGIYVDKMGISSPISLQAPDAPTDLAITPDYNGANKATISFKAPATDLNGDALETLTKIDVSRDGAVVKTFEAPAVGAELSFIDEVSKAATYTYEIVAYNNAGIGKSAVMKKFVGVNKPAGVTNLKVVETTTPGEVTFTWDAPSTDVDGNPINPSLITYTVCEFTTSYKYLTITEGLQTTTFTYQAVAPTEEQALKQWVIFSNTTGGEGQGIQTDVIAVGPDYEMPFIESVADGKLSYNFTSDQAKGGVWRPYTQETMPDVPAQDNDNGMFGMKGNAKDSYGSIASGKIKVSGNRPGLVFYAFNINGTEPDANEMNVYVREGNSEKLVSNTVMSGLANAGWNRVVVPLDAYKDKVIYLRFEAITRNYTYTFLDNIRVINLVDNNLTALTVEAPAKAKTDTEFDVIVNYENNGLNKAENYTVALYRNGEKVAEQPGEALESFLKGSVVLKDKLNVTCKENNTYHAEISFDADEDKSDNTTANATLQALYPKHPTVTALRAENTDSGIQLTWTAPDLSTSVPDAVTETFESSDPFATEFGDWTFLDLDGEAIGGMNNITLPGIELGSKQSFFVFDNTDAQFNSTFDAHSGCKYLASMFTMLNQYDFGTSNDWAISPRLYGGAQTISFFARSYHSSYKESVEILYSTGSLNPNDFISAGKYENIAHTWTEFKADLPEGARYFAIRSFAKGAFMLIVDDVTYIPASNAEGLMLKGYNVYRDGVKITETPITDTQYTDTQKAQSTYAVTAVYEQGESMPSTVNISTTGIDDINARGISIMAINGSIVVEGAEGSTVAIYSIDGRMVYSGIADTRTEVAVKPDMYIVKAGHKVAKIAVK